jgi:hypothetical protein
MPHTYVNCTEGSRRFRRFSEVQEVLEVPEVLRVLEVLGGSRRCKKFVDRGIGARLCTT